MAEAGTTKEKKPEETIPIVPSQGYIIEEESDDDESDENKTIQESQTTETPVGKKVIKQNTNLSPIPIEEDQAKIYEYVKIALSQMKLDDELLRIPTQPKRQEPSSSYNQRTVSTSDVSINLPKNKGISVKLPTYAGTNEENLDSWIFQVEGIFKMKAIDPQNKILCVITGLQGAALDWFHGWSSHKVVQTWETFLIDIRKAFKPAHHDMDIRNQLRVLRMTNDMHTYIALFRNLLGQITDMNTSDQIFAFVGGLPERVRTEVLLRRPFTIEDAYNIALMYDTSFK